MQGGVSDKSVGCLDWSTCQKFGQQQSEAQLSHHHQQTTKQTKLIPRNVRNFIPPLAVKFHASPRHLKQAKVGRLRWRHPHLSLPGVHYCIVGPVDGCSNRLIVAWVKTGDSKTNLTLSWALNRALRRHIDI